MFDIWKNLKDLVQVNEQKVYTTNAVFILHSKVTVVLLLALSILVTSRQYLSDPIECLSSSDIKGIADKYCWIHSTFTRAALLRDGKWGYEAALDPGDVDPDSDLVPPGIRPAIENDAARIYHTYYQWVWLVLFLQAGLFYIPYWLWRLFDRGRVKLLVADLNLEVITSIDDDDLIRQKHAILAYLTPNLGLHTRYAVQYMFCELLNTVIVVTQIVVTDAFLNWSFSSYGLGVFSLSQKHPYQRSDELARVFPTVTACRIATGGVAFGVMEYDILCVLPINILNEKIYIFLWFWFLGLAVLSCMNLVYRLLLILLPPMRRHQLQRRLRRSHRGNYRAKSRFVLGSSYADWFMLSQLADNLNPVVFAEILEELHDVITNNVSTVTASSKELSPPPPEQSNHKNGRKSGAMASGGVGENDLEELKPLTTKPAPVAPMMPNKFSYTSPRPSFVR